MTTSLRLHSALAIFVLAAPAACGSGKMPNGSGSSGMDTGDTSDTDTATGGSASASDSATATATAGSTSAATGPTTGSTGATTAGTGGGLSCAGDLPPFLTQECVQELAKIIFDATGVEPPCAWLRETLEETAKHSSDAVGPPNLFRQFLIYKSVAQGIMSLSGAASGPTRIDREPDELTDVLDGLVNIEDAFPCGDGPNGFTACTAGAPPFPTAAPVLVLAGIAREPIDPQSESWLLEYSFVFDADGDTSNNYVPDPAFPNDFFQDTDRWYVARWDGSTWSLDVSTATDGNIQPASSTARVVFGGNTALLLVSLDEFSAACPQWRVTTFAHTGDYGLNPPNEWGGTLEPPVDMGLNPCTM